MINSPRPRVNPELHVAERPDIKNSIDLDGYFGRIGYAGSRVPTLATLRAIHALHPASIAFENLDPLMGRRVLLDRAALQKKLIRGRRGGYCFEHNTLLAEVLMSLGFKVSLLAARVVMGGMPTTGRRTHMLLKVETAEGPQIADVGFGGRTLTAPLSLTREGSQETPLGVFCLVREGGEVAQQTKVGGEWTTLYRFSLDEQRPEEFDARNRFVSTDHASPFTSRLLAGRTGTDFWIGLMNNRFSLNRTDGTVTKRNLKNAGEIASVLQDEFGIALPEPRAELLAALARLPT